MFWKCGNSSHILVYMKFKSTTVVWLCSFGMGKAQSLNSKVKQNSYFEILMISITFLVLVSSWNKWMIDPIWFSLFIKFGAEVKLFCENTLIGIKDVIKSSNFKNYQHVECSLPTTKIFCLCFFDSYFWRTGCPKNLTNRDVHSFWAMYNFLP